MAWGVMIGVEELGETGDGSSVGTGRASSVRSGGRASGDAVRRAMDRPCAPVPALAAVPTGCSLSPSTVATCTIDDPELFPLPPVTTDTLGSIDIRAAGYGASSSGRRNRAMSGLRSRGGRGPGARNGVGDERWVSRGARDSGTGLARCGGRGTFSGGKGMWESDDGEMSNGVTWGFRRGGRDRRGGGAKGGVSV